MATPEDSDAGRKSPEFDLEQYRFEYTALPTASSIRLVTLATPSDYEGPVLFLSTKVVDLNDQPVYDALSYTWGNPISVFRTQQERADAEAEALELQTVVCDDRVMHIRQNLFEFLHSWKQMLAAASEKDDERVKEAREVDLLPPTELWIDAICINQEDIDEKSSQVNSKRAFPACIFLFQTSVDFPRLVGPGK